MKEKLSLSHSINKLKMTGYARKKLFRSFILVCLVPNILICVLGAAMVTHQLYKGNIRDYERQLENVSAAYGDILASYETMAADLSHLSWVKKMMQRAQAYDRFQLREYSRDLAVHRNSSSSIDFIGIYFYDKDLVVTSEGLLEFSLFNEHVMKIDGIPPMDWLKSHPLHNQQSATLNVPVTVYDVYSPGQLFLKTLSIDLGESDARALVFLFSRQKSLNTVLRQAVPDPLLKIGLLDGRGDVVAFTGENDPVLYGNSLQTFRESNRRTFFHGSSFVLVHTLERGQDALILTTPLTDLFAGLNAIILLLLSFLVVTLLFGTFLAYQLSQSNYQPLGNLLKLIPWRQGDNTDQDEYQYLQETVTTVIEQNQRITEQLEVTSGQVLTASLLKLINDMPVSEGELADATAFFPHPLFTCVIVQEGLMEDPEVSSTLFIDFELLLHTYGILFFQVSAQHSDYILNFDSADQLEALLEELCAQQSSFPDIFFSVGGTCGSVEELAGSYKKAQAASKYRGLHGQGAISRYEDAMRNDHYYYPIEDELRLASYIGMGNEKMALHLLDSLYGQNTGMEVMSPNGMRNFLYDVILTLAKVAKENSRRMPPILEDYLDGGQQRPELVFREAKTFLSSLCSSLGSYKTSQASRKWKEIHQLINEHICSSQMSLQFIADQFHISPSYVSQLFKENTGENFVDYVNFYRIDKSKDLLRETNLDIATIAGRCGFLSDSTYRRLFKKYVGCSPTSFRRQ